MEKISEKENKIVFKSDIEDSLANAIRRYVYKVPVVAIDEVKISKNDSALYDETLAHRIGLVPIKTEDSLKEDKEYSMNLKTNKEGYIYSGDIDGDLKVVYEGMPLTLLNKGQEIDIEGVARFGTGNKHAKFSPGMIHYRNLFQITLNKKFKEEIQRVYPNANISEKGDNIVVLDDREKEIADFCEGLAAKEGEEAKVEDTGKLIITIEEFGQIPKEEIFKKSIEKLKEDLEKISAELKK